MFNKIIALASTIALTVWAVRAQEPTTPLTLTLEQAQQYATEHNYTLQNATLEIRKAEANKWKTLSTMLPQVKVGFDYQNMCGYEMNVGGMGGSSSLGSMMPDSMSIGGTSFPVSFHFPETPSSGGSTGIVMNPNGTFSLTASIAVTGAQIVGTMINNLAIRMADISQKQSVQSTRSDVTNSYVSILVMEQTMKLLDSSLNNLQRLYDITKESVRVGVAEQIDADKLSVQLATLKNSISTTDRTLKLLRNSLILQLGANVNTEITLSTPLEKILNIQKATDLLSHNFNMENNYSYQLLKQNEELTRKQLTLAWMDFVPTVSAYYQYSSKTYFGKSEGFNMTPPNMIGASISLPIFESGTRIANIKAAKIALQETLNSKQQAEDALQLQFRQLRSNLINAIESYQIQRQNVSVTQRVFDNTSIKYQYGRASSLELTTASSDIITAQSNYIQAVLNVVEAQVALEDLLCEQSE